MSPLLTRQPGGPSTDTAQPPRPTLRRVRSAPGATDDVDPGPAPPATMTPAWCPRPGARETATVVLRIACEVLDGRRPPAHLADHVDGSVLRYWRTAAAVRHCAGPVRPRSAARFARMRLCHPHPEVAEVAVAVELDGGVRALAARFDHRGGRWRCTAIRLG